MTVAHGAAPHPSPERQAIAARLAVEVALVSLVAGATVAAAMRDVWAGAPQVLAAAGVLALRGRREPVRLGLAGRLGLTALALLYALAPGGDARHVLSRFLAGITAVTLLQPKTRRDHGLLLATALLQMALASVVGTSVTAALAGLVFVVAVHRALAAFHLLGAATRVERAGGRLVGASAGSRFVRSASRAAIASAALAVPLFAVLPRAEVPLFPVSAFRSASVGRIGDEVNLRGLGPRSGDDVVVGQVEPLDPAARDAAPYFAARSYDRFDGILWRSSDARSPVRVHLERGPVRVGPSPAARAASLRFDVSLDPSEGERVVLPAGAYEVEFRDPVPESVLVEASGAVYGGWQATPRRMAYRVTASAGAAAPPPRRRPGPELLDVPPAVAAAALAPLVSDVVEASGAPDAAGRAEALADWIRARCEYGEDGPTGDATGANGTKDPVGEFLLRRRHGHCEHFAAALAVCCRIAGVPARVVGGYHASRWNEVGGFWVLRRCDAHAWVEAFDAERGWVRVDATPSSAREVDPYRGLAGFLARVRDATAYAWTRHVVGYDAAARREAFDTVREAATEAAGAVGSAATHPPVLAAAFGVVAAVGLRRRARRGRGRRLAATPAVEFYRQALRALEPRRLGRSPSETADEHRSRVRPRLAPEEAASLDALVAAFESVRYGGAEAPAPAWALRHVETVRGVSNGRPRFASRVAGGTGPAARGAFHGPR